MTAEEELAETEAKLMGCTQQRCNACLGTGKGFNARPTPEEIQTCWRCKGSGKMWATPSGEVIAPVRWEDRFG